MSKYFTKFLPIDEEIKKGDKFTRDIGDINTCDNSHPTYNEVNVNKGKKGYKKVKLFLCSRDIQVGDIVYDKDGNDMGNCISAVSDSFILNDDSLYSKGNHFKVIGEISPDAFSYCKEGQEFDHSDLFLNGIGQNWNSKTPLSGKNIVKIKGPCGHFH